MKPAHLRCRIAACLVAIGLGVSPGVGPAHWSGAALAGPAGSNQPTPQELQDLARDLPDVISISRAFKTVAKIARPGVVHIRVAGGERTDEETEQEKKLRDQLKEAIPEEQLDRWLRRMPSGVASGIILDKDGYILTNNHVVEGREEINVILNDDREFSAKLIGTDDKTDLAVIKIEAPDLQPLKFGDSSQLEVGDWVIAVGSPFGLTQTVTHGIVSALGRDSIPGVRIRYQDFIQTDAAINPGNSGGPLLNLRGEVIGVNTAIASQGEGVNAGVAFTIPSNLAMRIANQLRESGTVQRGWLGVQLDDIRPSDVELFGLTAPHGVLIERVLKDSPAEKGGLQVEDVVIAIDDVELRNLKQLRNVVADRRPEERVRLRVVRDRQEREVAVRLALQPPDREAVQAPGTESREIPQLGLHVRTLREGMLLSYDADTHGVVVVDVSDDLKEDIKPRTVIVACDDKPIKSVLELQGILKGVRRGKSVTLKLQLPTGDYDLVPVKLNPSR